MLIKQYSYYHEYSTDGKKQGRTSVAPRLTTKLFLIWQASLNATPDVSEYYAGKYSIYVY